MQSTNFHAGLAAEHIVERHYIDAGVRLRARRWRGKGGEIDLILEDETGLIFVEVKKSHSFAHAAQRISSNQAARILATAEEFMGSEPKGLNTPARVDVALVNGIGQVQVIENALLAD
ncbi:MAG: YraN family protein [Pseudoruegeria sp.]